VSRLPALGPRGEGWFLLQVLLLSAIVVAGLQFGPDWSGTARLAGGLAGGVLLVGGLLLGLKGILDLDRAISPLPRPTRAGSLVQHGAYGRVRHPIYSGVIASSVGFGLLLASLPALLLCAILALLLDLKARREEIWLVERYAGYADYARRTKRFVPRLY